MNRGDDRAHDLRFRHRVRVGYVDTDQGGVAHHTAYLRWFESARIDALREVGIVYRDLEREGNLALPVAQLTMKYRAPARFDDQLDIESTVSRASRASLTFTQQVMRGTQLLAIGEVVLAAVALPAEKPTSVPGWLREKLGFVV